MNKEKIRRFNNEVKKWKQQFPNCKTVYDFKRHVAEVYACDDMNKFPKTIGYILNR